MSHTEHVAALIAPVADDEVPAGQSVHTCSPRSGLYAPVPHGTHESGPERWYPNSQVQFEEKLDVTGDHMCAGHAFFTPVQHHDPSSQAVQGSFATP